MATANSSSNILLILIQGDLDKLRDGVVFLTVHDVGTSYEVAWMMFIFTFIKNNRIITNKLFWGDRVDFVNDIVIQFHQKQQNSPTNEVLSTSISHNKHYHG